MPQFDKYICSVCGYIYDEQTGDLNNEIPPATKWENVPESWTCPACGVSKDEFDLVE